MYFKQRFPLILLLLTVALPGVSMADHSWGKYKWKSSSIPFNLNLGDNVDSSWDGHLLSASTDWSVSTVLGTTVVPGSTAADPLSCNPESGNVQVCNAEYGNNDWLGLAQIYTRGFTIIAGVAKLNDTYYKTAKYNTPAWRQMVMCQEVAHTFGLDHQDETFNNVNLGTCMDYTNDPDGTIDGELSNEYPNQHDYDQLEIIYAADDGGGGGGGGCNPRSPKCNPASAAGGHAQWGQLVSGHGGTEIYERNLGGGKKVITFVTWTLERTDSHEH
ncbi:MAG: hypothetical protein OEU74_08935 [Gammaproteobacteria bacterium]|nr:hypothetical protein [Gammaproteobacteria bacterium]